MTNTELIDKYVTLVAWFSDDFSLREPSDADCEEAKNLHDEIISRMNPEFA